MRIIEINSYKNGSTGSIMTSIAREAKKNGHEVIMCYPHSRMNIKAYQKGDYLIGNRITRNIGALLHFYFGIELLPNLLSTLMLLFKIIRVNPDIIHLHNLHGSYLNLPVLFLYLKITKKRTIWTLHDCWSFTGHCAHYVDISCGKWKTSCNNCPKYSVYPATKFDNSRYAFFIKKKFFTSIKNLHIVTVSQWLQSQVQESFLSRYPISVITPGVNRDVFTPSKTSSFRTKYDLNKKFVILGVATAWSKNKGLFDYFELNTRLKDDEVIVLVGLSKNQILQLPSGIIGIERTESRKELIEIYSEADVLLSLSRAETFGLTIVEAMSCGTPAIVYDNTAQSELVPGKDMYCVATGDIEDLYKHIHLVKYCDKQFSFTEYARRYDEIESLKQYMQLFSSI